ncbi:hypothetical protein [Azospirillum largimobile]
MGADVPLCRPHAEEGIRRENQAHVSTARYRILLTSAPCSAAGEDVSIPSCRKRRRIMPKLPETSL